MTLKHYYIYLILFIITGFFSLQTQAQTIEVTGVVKDSINQPLAYANVFAVPQNKEINIAFATTNKNGKYQLKIHKNKKYNVTTSYLGFTAKKTVFNFTKDTIYNFVLKEDLNQLAEIEIKYTIPVVVKKDTITYNASSFTTGNERKLKDLLKKLPGVEVDRDGNVLANGKKVTKLLVENKPFFGGNTKLGVKNIPADAIDKVQVLENYNEVAMLKGLQDNDNVALNIKLKKDKQKFVFGDIETGIGHKNKYLVHPKLFYYSPKTSANFIGDVNNTGKKAFTIKDYIEFEGGISKLFTDSGSYFKLYSSNFANYLNNQDYKKDNTTFGAFNLRQSLSKVIDISMYVISAKAVTSTQNTSSNQYLYTTPFTENRTDTKETTNFYTIGKLTLDYDPNKKTDYSFNSSLKLSNNNSIGNIATNSISNNYNVETVSNLETFSFKQDVSLNNSLSKKHTLTLNINYTYQKDKPNLAWNTNQELLENLIPITTENYYQIRQNKNISLQNINAVLKEYWSLHRFHHIYTSIGINKAKTSFYNKDWQLLENNTINNFNTANFGNDLDYSFLDAYLGLEYKFKIGKATFKPAAFYHNYYWSTQQKNENKIYSSKKIFLPQFTAKVAFKNSEKLIFKYRLKSNFPDIKMLSNQYILSSFNRVYKGNSTLENTLYNSLSIRYYKFNFYKGYRFSISGNFNKKIKSFKNVNQLNGINQFSTQIMFEEPEINWSINGVFSKTVKKIRAKVSTNYRYNDYYQLLNNNQSLNTSNTISITPSIKTKFKKIPNIEIGYKKDFTTYQNTQITKYTNESVFTYLDYDFENFIFEANFEYNAYKNKTDHNIDNSYIDANASVFYQKENSAWGFEISGTNLFSAKYKQSNSQNEFIITDTKTFTLPRIIMLKIIYKI